jgi:D-tyrosyl-tRNA(Tyr) deacylase
MLDKLLGLRVFPDERGDMNVDIRAHGGEILVVSQFTLYADCRKGRRPSFHLAAPAAEAKRAYDLVVDELGRCLPGKVQSGRFGADMLVSLINWGPVTIMLDSDDFGA